MFRCNSSPTSYCVFKKHLFGGGVCWLQQTAKGSLVCERPPRRKIWRLPFLSPWNHSYIRSFSPSVFVEGLLHARHWARSWWLNSEKNHLANPVFMGICGWSFGGLRPCWTEKRWKPKQKSNRDLSWWILIWISQTCRVTRSARSLVARETCVLLGMSVAAPRGMEGILFRCHNFWAPSFLGAKMKYC